MAADIESESLLLESQRFLRRPLGHGRIDFAGFSRTLAGRSEHAEDVDLMACLIALVGLARLHGVVQSAVHARSGGPGGIEGAALDQAFDDAPVDRRHIDAPAKIEEGFEDPVLATAFEDDFDGLFADVFDAGQAEAGRRGQEAVRVIRAADRA